MKGWFAHHSAAHQVPLDDELEGPGRPLTFADRACCCPARPVVTVVMPPAPGRPHPVDLLLCGHHSRVSRAALDSVGAVVYDETGALIRAGAGEQPFARRQPLAA